LAGLEMEAGGLAHHIGNDPAQFALAQDAACGLGRAAEQGGERLKRGSNNHRLVMHGNLCASVAHFMRWECYKGRRPGGPHPIGKMPVAQPSWAASLKYPASGKAITPKRIKPAGRGPMNL